MHVHFMRNYKMFREIRVAKLQNDLALVQDVLRRKPRERHDRFHERF